jgi:hypothetical protein
MMILLELDHLLVHVVDLSAQLGAEFLLESHRRLLIESWEGIHGGGVNTGWIPLDGCTGVVDISGEIANGRIISVKNLKSLLDRYT